MPDLAFSTVAQQAAWVADGHVSSRELVEHSLARIDRLDPELNAFRTVLRAEALAEADARDGGESLGPLHGVPLAIKDENDVRGTTTTFGTGAVTRVAEHDGEIVRRLRAAGAVIVGKTLMPEFGLWPFTESETYGITRNPWDLDRSPAGSSGGTAAAVAAGMVAAGIGGDGGGSIRLPSSWCGLFGLKPQRGRVSAAPAASLWGSLGTAGPLTRTVLDSALIFDVIAGSTPVDHYRAMPWAGTLVEAATSEPRPLRIRVATKNPAGGTSADAETLRALEDTAEALANLGHRVDDGRVPDYRPWLAFLSQVAAGVGAEAKSVDRPDLLEERTRQGIALTAALRGFARTGERKARALSQHINAVFDEVDLLLTPTTATAAVPAGQLGAKGFLGVSANATDVASFTSIWNVLGNPAASVPSGFTADGLPLAVQLVGPFDSEPLIVQVAAQIERVRPWAHRRPPSP